jgi:hypothetical protein
LLPPPVHPPEDFEPRESVEPPESLDRLVSLDPDEPDSDADFDEPDEDELSPDELSLDEPDPLAEEAVALSWEVEAVEELFFDERLSVL